MIIFDNSFKKINKIKRLQAIFYLKFGGLAKPPAASLPLHCSLNVSFILTR